MIKSQAGWSGPCGGRGPAAQGLEGQQEERPGDMGRRDNGAVDGWQAALKGWAAPHVHATHMRPALPGQASWCMPRQEVTASRLGCSGRALARPLGPARHPSGPTTPSGWHRDQDQAGRAPLHSDWLPPITSSCPAGSRAHCPALLTPTLPRVTPTALSRAGGGMARLYAAALQGQEGARLLVEGSQVSTVALETGTAL